MKSMGISTDGQINVTESEKKLGDKIVGNYKR